MLSRFLPIFLCLLFMYSGCKLFKINEGKTNDSYKIAQKSLCDNGLETTAILQNEYTELEVGSSVSYQYKFDYEVNGQSYTGNFSRDEELEIPVIKITYDSKNPESYLTSGNACEIYAAVKDNPSKWPQWFEYVGVGMFLLALGFIQSSAIRAFKGVRPSTE